MKRLALYVLAALFGSLLVVLPTTPANAATCYVATKTDYHRFDTPRWVDVSTSVHFRQCVSDVNGNRWVDPISVTFRTNQEGTHTDCDSPINYIQGAKFKFYMWDGRGVNYDIPLETLDCQFDTVNERTVSLSNSPNFRYCRTVPKWKSNVTLKKFAADDDETVLNGRLWDYVGPVIDEC